MIVKGRQAIAERFGIAKRTVTWWANHTDMPHTTEKDENGNKVIIIDTDSVGNWLIEREVNKVKDRLALIGKGG